MEEKEKGLLEINSPFSGSNVKRIVVNDVEITLEGLTSLAFTVDAGEIINFECRYNVKDKNL